MYNITLDDTSVSSKMNDQWKLVQKKVVNTRGLPAVPSGPHADSPIPFQSQLTPVANPRVLMKRVKNDESKHQTDVKSLIGSPFVIRSSNVDDSDLNENEEGNRKVKYEQSSSNMRVLKIGSREDRNGTHISRNVEENVKFCQVNEFDWPHISENQQQCTTDVHVLNASSNESSSKMWSNVIKTAPSPHSIGEIKSSTRNSKLSEQEKNDKSVPKDKKREAGKFGAATERQRDQPLLLEFESLFESLQVQGSKKVIASGGAPVVLNKPTTKQDTHHRGMLNRGNILDSSAPATRRGKERETPKKKRPSALRKVISYEKEQRKTGVPNAEASTATNETTETGAVVDFTRKVKPSIHNRRFREYCNHIVKEEINLCVEQLLSDLVRFQDRIYLKDPIKAKAKRRYVCGLREVLKHLNLRKLKCVILPPNLDRIQSKGGINDVTQQILDKCSEQQLPVIFAMSRRRLAIVLKKSHKVGCVGIFSYDGAEVHYKLLLTLVETARTEYEAKLSAVDTSVATLSDVRTAANYLSKCDPDEADIDKLVDSSSESDLSDMEDGLSEQHGIISSPWKIFFEPLRNQDQVAQLSESPQLNVNASEFVPPFKLNVDAKEFVPVL